MITHKLNTNKDIPDIGDDIAGDMPGMAGDTPIMGCGGPTLGNKVGSYEGNAAIFYISTVTPSVYLQWYMYTNTSHAPITIDNIVHHATCATLQSLT